MLLPKDNTEKLPKPVATSCGCGSNCCADTRPSSCCNRPNDRSDREPSPRAHSLPRSSRKAAPGPAAVAIRRPVVVVVDNRSMRTPDPAVVVRVGPVAIGIEIFRTPNVVIVVLNIVAKTLGQVSFATRQPSCPRNQPTLAANNSQSPASAPSEMSSAVRPSRKAKPDVSE